MVDLPASPFTVADAAAVGLTRKQLHVLVRTGVARRLVTGVYADAGTAVTPVLMATAVARMAPPGQVIVDRTAAQIHGVSVLSPGERGTVIPVETCALRGHPRTEMAGARGRHRTLDPGDIMTVGGIQVTTPLRTALDLGCALRRRDAMAVLNAFARHHGVTTEQLLGELPRYRGRRGVIQLRQLVPLVDARIESVGESWVWLEICESGLPRPTPQHWILIGGVPTYRLDFAYVAQRITVEYDGEDFHDGEDQQTADEERRGWLRRNGWTVIVVRKGDFTGRRLDAWLAKIRRALAEVATNRRW